MIPRIMGERLAELIGRVMTDPEFLVDLQRSPQTVLAQYELAEDERAAVLKALARLADAPASQRGPALHAALLRRVAT